MYQYISYKTGGGRGVVLEALQWKPEDAVKYVVFEYERAATPENQSNVVELFDETPGILEECKKRLSRIPSPGNA